MKQLFTFLALILITTFVSAQTIGTTKTEEFKAEFEKKKTSQLILIMMDHKYQSRSLSAVSLMKYMKCTLS